jgi:cellulose synthase/poly-beta-1,6-N-acetylglucosamine synthase-like glycosyltransferase
MVLYPYFLYPLLLAVLGWFLGRPVRRQAGQAPTVSFVMCVHNEALAIEQRIADLLSLIDRNNIRGEVIVVSDGSTDATVTLAKQTVDPRLRLIELPTKKGKAAALSQGVALAQNEILVFCDVRQRWAEDALPRLLENFADPQVGAVSGDLVLESPTGALSGVGLYWKYEKWIRKREGHLWAQIGVTGAISAVRRELFQPIPAGTLLDDVYWPLRVAMAGYRVIHDERAIAYDRLPPRTKDEFQRKVRTLAGNLQLAARLPIALVPLLNPVWFQWLSHKLMRLLVPWALVAVFVSNLFLLDSLGYRLLFTVQLAGYTLGVLGLILPRAGRMAALASSFLVLNGAAWMAWWVWGSGRAGQSWQKVQYRRSAVNHSSESALPS